MAVWRGRPRPRMLVVRVPLFPAILAEKCHKPLPEHVERSQKCSKQSDGPVNPVAEVSLKQNRVLAEEPRQWPESGDGKSPSRHGPECPRNFRPQAAHLAHVLLAGDGVDH